jgi:lactoylglutathione lyase
MKTGRVILLVLEVADLERSLHFYRELIGVPLKADIDHAGAGHGDGDRWISGDHAALSFREGAFLHFALYQSRGVVTRGLQIGFPTDDLDGLHAKLIAAGITCDHGPRDEPWGRTARYLDPDGNSVSLTETKNGM